MEEVGIDDSTVDMLNVIENTSDFLQQIDVVLECGDIIDIAIFSSLDSVCEFDMSEEELDVNG